MNPPVLTERVGLPHLPGVVVPVRRVLTLQERGVDPPADPRLSQGRQDRRHRAEDHPGEDLDDPALLPSLLDRGIVQPRWRDLLRDHASARPAAGRGRLTLPVGRQDRRLVGRVGVAGHQPQHTPSGPPLDLLDHLLDVLDVAGPGHDAEHQPVLGVVGDVVPPVPMVRIGGVVRVAMLLLLEDERPLLVELDLLSPGGKKPRTRRGVAGRGRRPGGRSGPRCWGPRRRVGRWHARRCGRRGVGTPSRPCPDSVGNRTGASPSARRTGSGRCGSRGVGYACACRSGRRPSGCRGPLAMIGTIVVLAAEAGKILVHDSTSLAQQKRG